MIAEANELAAKVALLSTPAAYPERPAAVLAVETHFAHVFLTGLYAYKLKKPLSLGAIHYGTLAARERACHNELRLNRRLAPDVYLDVVPLCRSVDGTLRLGGPGRTVDWLVKMRRLPAARMLDVAMRAGAVPAVDIENVMAQLCRFFRSAARASFDGPRYVQRLARDTAQEQRALTEIHLESVPELLAQLTALQLKCFDALGGALAARAEAGRVVDGHGDLRPEHVSLGPPVAIIDCLEFDANLRLLDSAEEIAFLALECQRADAAAVGAQLIEAYRERCRDAIARPLLDFYRSRRALVRARLAAWHLRDADCRDPARWHRTAAAYLRLGIDAARGALQR